MSMLVLLPPTFKRIGSIATKEKTLIFRCQRAADFCGSGELKRFLIEFGIYVDVFVESIDEGSRLIV